MPSLPVYPGQQTIGCCCPVRLKLCQLVPAASGRQSMLQQQTAQSAAAACHSPWPERPRRRRRTARHQGQQPRPIPAEACLWMQEVSITTRVRQSTGFVAQNVFFAKYTTYLPERDEGILAMPIDRTANIISTATVRCPRRDQDAFEGATDTKSHHSRGADKAHCTEVYMALRNQCRNNWHNRPPFS